MTEYLVRKGDGPWHIARPGAVEDQEQECKVCQGTGRPRIYESGEFGATTIYECKDCGGTGRIGLGRIRLGWFDRDDGLVDFDDNIDQVERLPE